MELEQFILDLKPSSPKTIITITYVLGLYAKWLQEQGMVDNDSFYQMVQSFDKKLLWKKAKPQAKKKFISHEQYKKVLFPLNTPTARAPSGTHAVIFSLSMPKIPAV